MKKSTTKIITGMSKAKINKEIEKAWQQYLAMANGEVETVEIRADAMLALANGYPMRFVELHMNLIANYLGIEPEEIEFSAEHVDKISPLLDSFDKRHRLLTGYSDIIAVEFYHPEVIFGNKPPVLGYGVPVSYTDNGMAVFHKIVDGKLPPTTEYVYKLPPRIRDVAADLINGSSEPSVDLFPFQPFMKIHSMGSYVPGYEAGLYSMFSELGIACTTLEEIENAFPDICRIDVAKADLLKRAAEIKAAA